MKKGLNPKFFKNGSEFRGWLEKNHLKKQELIVGFYKVKSGKPSMTWSESVDQALCFGWIDGIRRSVDAESYCIRFTPRKSGSNWSALNIQKVAQLNKRGLMTKAGMVKFEARTEAKTSVYAYENTPVTLSDEYEKIFRSDKRAWKFYLDKPPYYRKTTARWVMAAKREETRKKRLRELIEDCMKGREIKSMRYGK